MRNWNSIWFLAVTIAVMAGTLSPANAVDLTDLAGRKVTLEKPAQRVVLGSSNYLEALAIVLPEDPVGRIVGVAKGPTGSDPAILKQVNEKWPGFQKIPQFGGRGAESVSVEKILTLKPDVAIFGIADHGPGAKAAELIGQLQKAGIKTVFIDFRMDPLKNTARSIEILGKVFGKQERAKAFADYHNAGLQLIRERVAKLKTPPPKVFLQAHVGRMACCVGMASGMLGPMVGLAGGKNVSAEVSPGPVGRHSMEFLISQQIDVFIGTASGQPLDFESGKAMIVLGGEVSEELALASLKRATAAPGFHALPAWKRKRIHAIWHNFYNSPFNLYAALKFAKWIRPEAFQDIDAEAKLKDLIKTFTPFEMPGTYAISLGP